MFHPPFWTSSELLDLMGRVEKRTATDEVEQECHLRGEGRRTLAFPFQLLRL